MHETIKSGSNHASVLESQLIKYAQTSPKTVKYGPILHKRYFIMYGIDDRGVCRICQSLISSIRKSE